MPTEAEVYGYGTLANVLCCLCSIGGAFILPFARNHRKANHVIMSVFMGLAVGTLAADALLHLIPEALDLHHHGEEEHMESLNASDTHEHEDEEDHHHEEGRIKIEPYVWYCMIVLAGSYLFYLMEMAMVLYQVKMQGKKISEDSSDIAMANGFGVAEEKFRPISETQTTFGSNEITSQEEKNEMGFFKPIVVMILLGDGIHNFADGLAVAASFNKSIVEGISTTLAIICHELPHELGDFAVLINNGLSFKKALIANFISSLTALVGFYVGVSISKENGAGQWIFGVTAGFFLYIALTDMLPQLITSGGKSVRTTIYHNIGILLGALVIILLSIYEQYIEI